MRKRRSGGEEGKPFSDHREEKSSEGQSPGALEAEKVLQGGKLLYTAGRVAKPYERDFPGATQSSRDVSNETKNGALSSGYAEGSRCSGEALWGSASKVDVSLKPQGGEAGAKTLRWRRSAREEQPESKLVPRGARNRRPEGPGRTEGRTGWMEAMTVLGSRAEIL